jgi:YD repeat-containing protein
MGNNVKVLLGLVLMIFSAGVMADDYYYLIDSNGSDPSATQYATADEACRAVYAADVAAHAAPDSYDAPLPYAPPTLTYSAPPKYEYWECDVSWTDSKDGDTFTHGHSVSRFGDNCTAEESYNPVTGYCESPDKEQDRKELGDVTSPLTVGFTLCGDPVNPANGNVFESETDYADQDGELRFVRNYNSRDSGVWANMLDTRVYPDTNATPKGAVVRFDDGRTALFIAKNGGLVPDGGELGSLLQNSAGWVYTSPLNEQMTFNTVGQLVRWQRADGRATTISYAVLSIYDTAMTVTDSLGHQMVYTTHYGAPLSLVIGNLTVNYVLDAQFRISGVKKTWPGHSTTRTYLYEDTTQPKLLTGVIDERGVRVSTWAYDSNGRAVSAAMAGGKGAFSFAYNADGSTTVTNPLGHPVVYRFDIVQGAKRITAIEGEPIAGCPASNSTFAYTANAQLDSRTDAVGNTTAFTYDTQGRETSRVEAKGTANERTTTTTWDGTTFRPATVTTSDRVTTYTYDPQGRLLSTQNHSVKE